MTTDNRTQAIAAAHPSFIKAASRLFFNIAICKQLNAAPYAGQPMFTNLAPRPMTVLGTRLRVHMRTTFENDIYARTAAKQCCEQLYSLG